MIDRRSYLKAALGGIAVGVLTPGVLRAVVPPAADESALIYLTPLQTSGRESSCQGEVWFVREGDVLYVVTQASAWRAEAVRRGLTSTRIWIGDVGVWKNNPEYRDLPHVMATASLIADPGMHARVLERFGAKYAREWGQWGPRFKNGLAEGSRVMLGYQT